MVTKIIRANISDEERKKILHSVQILAGEMVKEINKGKSNKKVHSRGESNE